jgi:hypothetical protein
MIVYSGPVGRDTLYVWLDRPHGKDRVNAAVRGPARWVHVTQVAPESLGQWGSKPHDMVEKFAEQVIAAMQGRQLNFEHSDISTVFRAMLDDVAQREPSFVKVVDFNGLAVNRPNAYRRKQPVQKVGHTTVFCRYSKTRCFMTWVPMLYFESGKYVSMLAQHYYTLVGGISEEGEEFIYRDGVICALES